VRQFPPATGGLESVVHGLSRALQDSGHQVNVVTLNRIFSTGEKLPSYSVVNGMSVTRISHWGSRRYPIAPAVFRHVRGHDVIHIHAVDFFLDFLSLTKMLHSCPIVLTTHGGIFHTKWLSALKSAYFRTVTRQSLKRVSMVMCVSQQDYEAFSSIVPPEKLRLVPNGVEIEPYLHLQKSVSPGLLLGIGRVAENKAVDTIIHAVAQLRHQHPAVKLTWVGPDEDSRIAKLNHLASRLGVERQVHFRGKVSSKDLETLLTSANLFVSSSIYEGYGLSTIEAMSSGTVPVVTRVGIHPHIIENGKTGFLVDGDVSSFVRGLRAALELDVVTLESMGALARRASRQCLWEQVARTYADAYEAVLAHA